MWASENLPILYPKFCRILFLLRFILFTFSYIWRNVIVKFFFFLQLLISFQFRTYTTSTNIILSWKVILNGYLKRECLIDIWPYFFFFFFLTNFYLIYCAQTLPRPCDLPPLFYINFLYWDDRCGNKLNRLNGMYN